jgi:RNA polymerase sigma-32 factor
VERIARTLDVSNEEVVSMNRRLAGQDASLNAAVGEDGESEWQDWLVDERDSPETMAAVQEEQQSRSALMTEALDTLQARERHILTERRLKDEPSTLEQLAKVYGISRERVRQLEARAFEKLQKAMKAKVAAVRGQGAVPSLSAA